MGEKSKFSHYYKLFIHLFIFISLVQYIALSRGRVNSASCVPDYHFALQGSLGSAYTNKWGEGVHCLYIVQRKLTHKPVNMSLVSVFQLKVE